MLGEKSTIRQDLVDFLNTNGLIGGRYSLDVVLGYANLVESRIRNNILLLNNPSLCSQYDISPEDLYTELDALMEIRKKISFGCEQNKKMR